MKNLTIAAVLLGGIVIVPSAHAQSAATFFDDIEVTSTIDTLSEYVFRGISAGGSSVRPGTEFNVYGFSAGTLYTAGFGEDSAAQLDQLDIFVGYQLPFDGPIQVEIGGTAYVFPQGRNIADGSGGTVATYEIDGTIGAKDVFLSPSVFVAYDFTLENFTVEGNLSHTFDLPRAGWSLDARLNAGHVDLSDNQFTGEIPVAFDSYQYGTATLAANKQITDNISYYISGNFTVNSEDNVLSFDIDEPGFRDSDTAFWLGTGLAVDF